MLERTLLSRFEPFQGVYAKNMQIYQAHLNYLTLQPISNLCARPGEMPEFCERAEMDIFRHSVAEKETPDGPR